MSTGPGTAAGRRTITLPPTFMIGTATSAHQVEGGLDDKNDIGDFTLTHPFNVGGDYIEPAGTACDHYNRFPQDLDMLTDLGLNVYRFGIEWARIEPEPGKIDEKEIRHYRQVLEACRARGITPIVTLQHFTSPKWLIKEGGWESHMTPAYFARFAKLVTERYGDLIVGDLSRGESRGYICTLNEVNTGALNETVKGHPNDRVKTPAWLESAARLGVEPERFRPWKFASTEAAVRTIVKAHQLAVAAIKSVRTDIPVGLTMASQDIVPLDPENPVHVWRAAEEQWKRENRFWELLRAEPDLVGDFIGVQPYTHLRVGERPDGSVGILEPPEGARLVKAGYEFAPQTLENCVRRTHALFPDMPLLCTEFGVSTDYDGERVEYLQLGLEGASRCVEAGINLTGILAWSTMDNFEWSQGFEPRYGVIAVDYQTQERTPKASARFLSQVARQHEFVIDGTTAIDVMADEDLGLNLGSVTGGPVSGNGVSL